PISERIYRMSEAKQHVIKEKFDMMVRASIGHDIFYNNNNDIKTGKSHLKINPEDIDYNGYDLFYSGEIISNIKNEIIEIFHEHNYFTLSGLSDILIDYQIKFIINSLTSLRERHLPFITKNGKSLTTIILEEIKQLNPTYRSDRLIKLLNQFIKDKVDIGKLSLSNDKIVHLVERYRDKFIIMALEELISNKVTLFDKYGFTVYLRENNGYFYIDRNYPAGGSSNSCMMYYTDNIVTIENQTFENILNVNESVNIFKSLNKIKEINDDSKRLNEYLDSLTIRTQSNILFSKSIPPDVK
ncbi:unnamed protein product, partial [marine sediment metagenome]